MSAICDFHILACSANLPTGLYMLPSVFLNWAKLSQDLLDKFSRFFHQMECICVNVVNPDQIFRFLKGRCHGKQFGQNWRNGLHWALWHFKMQWNIVIWIISFIVLMNPIHRVQNNMVNFGPVMPEIEVWEICTLETIRQKVAYLTKYLYTLSLLSWRTF